MKFGYVEREFEEGLDLDMYEMDWRQYDPAVGRFFGADKLSEGTYNLTPYQYGNNNPIFFKDPTGLVSTVVDDDGVVTDYENDGDSNIYLNRRGGEVVGTEEEGREYKKGEKIFNVDHTSNPDYSLYSLISSAVSSKVSAFTVAVGVLKIKKTIPVYYPDGSIFGYFKVDIKFPGKALIFVNGVLKVTSGALTALSAVKDLDDYASNRITGGHYTYKVAGTAATLYTASAAGGPAGVAVGGIVYLGDMIYQAGAEISDAKRNHPNPKIRNSKWYDLGTMLNEVKNIMSNSIWKY